MKDVLIIILTIFTTVSVVGQTLVRETKETAQMFVNRFKPDSTKVHAVVETNNLDASKSVIIAFYKKTIYEVRQMETYVDHSQYDKLIGYAFVSSGENNYNRTKIGVIGPDGGDPEILNIFFANADKDKGLELIVLCKLEQRHYDYEGAFYVTYIYNYTNKFQYLQELSEKFFGVNAVGEMANQKKQSIKRKRTSENN